MDGKAAIHSVLKNTAQAGWVVFRFHFWRGLFMLAVKVLYVALFAAGTFILAQRAWQSIDPLPKVFTGLLFCCAVIAFVVLLQHLRSLFFANSNMIVLTQDAVVKSWCGKITEYPYSAIQELAMVHERGQSRPYASFAQQRLQFVDGRTGQTVQLAHNTVFGRATKIYASLQTKLI